MSRGIVSADDEKGCFLVTSVRSNNEIGGTLVLTLLYVTAVRYSASTSAGVKTPLYTFFFGDAK